LNFIGLHLKTEINEALVTNSKHHRSPYISTTFMRFPCFKTVVYGFSMFPRLVSFEFVRKLASVGAVFWTLILWC
ncbi:hypothetical protein ABMX79_22245, partial [Vibrio vulnificus]